jgi:hypothetical protein
VVLAFAAPVAPALASDPCLGALGELDVIARPCAFDRRDTVDALALLPVFGAFLAAAASGAVLRRRMLRLRWGGRR